MKCAIFIVCLIAVWAGGCTSMMPQSPSSLSRSAAASPPLFRNVDASLMGRGADGLMYKDGEDLPFNGEVTSHYSDGVPANRLLLHNGLIMEAVSWKPGGGEVVRVIAGEGSILSYFEPEQSGTFPSLKTETWIRRGMIDRFNLWDRAGNLLPQGSLAVSPTERQPAKLFWWEKTGKETQ